MEGVEVKTVEGLLRGRVALITGTGSGVGRAMAIFFAKNGATVAAVDVVPTRVDEVVRELGS